MNASHIKNCIRALAVADFLSAFGPVGAVAQSTAQIENWRKLAEQGNATAQFNPGVLYANGEGVSQNHKLAMQWYRKPAEQGQCLAPVKLCH
jgi:TPR repeat protein